jgi:hypothetical protein
VSVPGTESQLSAEFDRQVANLQRLLPQTIGQLDGVEKPVSAAA